MKLEFEYGHGTMAAELPDNTDVFIPGVTVPDPPCIPEDKIVAVSYTHLDVYKRQADNDTDGHVHHSAL